MRKLLTFLILVAILVWGVGVIRDRVTLDDGVIRLHVVGETDSKEDQQIKLQVRDAVLQKINSVMQKMPDMETAKAYLQENLSEIESICNQVLASVGESAKAAVTMVQEKFPTRHYDTFSLPAGVYESLRITIGEGEGKNWWCVVFPRLCVATTSSEMKDTAVDAGFSKPLSGALTGQTQYKVRFFVLDCLGWLENWLHKG